MGLDILLFFSLLIQNIHEETRHSRLPQVSEQCFHKTLNILPSFVLVIFFDRFLTIMIEIVLILVSDFHLKWLVSSGFISCSKGRLFHLNFSRLFNLLPYY